MMQILKSICFSLIIKRNSCYNTVFEYVSDNGPCMYKAIRLNALLLHAFLISGSAAVNFKLHDTPINRLALALDIRRC